jgi:hypothetical protein
MPVAERVGNIFVSQPHSQTAPAARRQRRPHSGAALPITNTSNVSIFHLVSLIS